MFLVLIDDLFFGALYRPLSISRSYGKMVTLFFRKKSHSPFCTDLQSHICYIYTKQKSKKHRLPIISYRQAMYSFFGRSVRGGLFHADELVVLSFYRRFDDLGGDFLCESNDGGIGVMVGCSAFDAFDSFKGLLHSCFAVFTHHAFDL